MNTYALVLIIANTFGVLDSGLSREDCGSALMVLANEWHSDGALIGPMESRYADFWLPIYGRGWKITYKCEADLIEVPA